MSIHNMFYRLSRDTFTRPIGDFGYIFSQLAKHDPFDKDERQKIKDVICNDKEFIPFELRGVYFEITKNRNVVAHALESNFSSGKIIESLRTSLITAGKYIN